MGLPDVITRHGVYHPTGDVEQITCGCDNGSTDPTPEAEAKIIAYLEGIEAAKSGAITGQIGYTTMRAAALGLWNLAKSSPSAAVALAKILD